MLQGASEVQPHHSHPARGRGVPQAERSRNGRQKQRRSPTRVVLVESHPIFRDGLIQCLHAAPDFRVVGHLDSGHVDVAALGALSPGLVLMNVELPGQSGIDAARDIREALPRLRVVMLTSFADRELVFGALDAGAVGYLLKNTPPWELIETLRQIVRGEPMLTHGSAAGLLQELQRRQSAIPPVRLPPLTRREQDVLRLLASGKTNRQIAHQLDLSGETIKSHLASIFRKLGVSDRTGAAIRAVKAQLVDP